MVLTVSNGIRAGLAWLLGVPASILLIIFIFARGCWCRAERLHGLKHPSRRRPHRPIDPEL